VEPDGFSVFDPAEPDGPVFDPAVPVSDPAVPVFESAVFSWSNLLLAAFTSVSNLANSSLLFLVLSSISLLALSRAPLVFS